MGNAPAPATGGSAIQWVTKHQEVVFAVLVTSGIIVVSRFLKKKPAPVDTSTQTQLPVFLPTTEYYIGTVNTGPGACNANQHWDSVQQLCVLNTSTCDPGYMLDPATNTCVLQNHICPQDRVWDSASNSCIVPCGAGEHIDPVTSRCTPDVIGPLPCSGGAELCNGICWPICTGGRIRNTATCSCDPPPENCPPGAVWSPTAMLGNGGCVFETTPPPGNNPPPGTTCGPGEEWSDRFQMCLPMSYGGY